MLSYCHELQIAIIADFRSVAQMCVFENMLHTHKDENH